MPYYPPAGSGGGGGTGDVTSAQLAAHATTEAEARTDAIEAEASARSTEISTAVSSHATTEAQARSAGLAQRVEGVTEQTAQGPINRIRGEIFQTADPAAAWDNGMNFTQFSYSLVSALHGSQAGGTEENPEAVVKGAMVWGLGARPHDGEKFTEHSAAAVNFWAEEDFAPGHHGASVGIGVTPVGSPWGMRSEIIRFLRRAADQGGRITGDFSTIPRKQRLMLQTSTANEATNVGALPNGNSRIALFTAWNAGDPDNAAYGALLAQESSVDLVSGITGAGTPIPLRATVGGNVGAAWGTDGVLDALSVPTAQAYQTVAQEALAANTYTPVTFDSEAWDTNGLHNPASPTRMTAPVAGKYRVIASLQFAAHAAGARLAHFRVNGVTTDRRGQAGTNTLGDTLATPLLLFTEVQLAAGDYVEVYAYQASGGPLGLLAENPTTPNGICRFTMTYVGS